MEEPLDQESRAGAQLAQHEPTQPGFGTRAGAVDDSRARVIGKIVVFIL